MIRRRTAPVLSIALLALVAASAALGQDINQRRGFSVEITEPETGEIVAGPSLIKAEAQARRPEDIASVKFYVNDELIFVDTTVPYQVEYDFGRASRQHVIRAVAVHEDGPEVSDFVITRTLDLKYFVNVQRVILDVSVRDGDRHVVTGLGAEDFVVKEDGEPQRIVEVSTEERPILVGVLIDSSGSMRGRIEAAREAACGFMETLRDEDRLFVVDFDERVYLIEETTHDTESACKSLATTVPVGGTALYDAIHASFRVIYEPKAERRALIILSDGDDADSRIDFDSIMEEALLSDVTIYAIGLDTGALSTARTVLRRLSERTGGRAFFIKEAEELASAYELIAEELRTLYQVVYASDNESFDGRFLDVEVEVTAEGARDYDIRHRSGYYAVERAPNSEGR